MFIQTLDPQLVLQKWESAGGSRPSDKGGGGRGGHPDSEINWGGAGGGLVYQKIFSALRASVWSKNKEEGARPPGPLP